MISNEDKKALADNYFEDGKKFKVDGKYREALKTFQKAYKIHKKISAINSAGDLSEIAECQKEIGNLEMADKAFCEAEHAFVSMGCNNEDLAACLIGHANLCRDRGNYPDAESLYKRALSIYEKALGPDHPDVATTLNNFGLLKCATGQYADAEPLYQRALDICEEAFGPEHPDAAMTLNNFAFLKYKTGQFTDAETLYQRALSIYGKSFGPDHPDFATTINNFASLKRDTGQYVDAELLYQRALNIREKALRPDHPDTATTLDSIAMLKSHTGQYEEADLLYQRALNILEKAFGPDHPDVAGTLNNLAALKDSTGQYAKAEPLYQRALNIREKALGPLHPDVAGTLNNFAELKRKMGQYADAEPLYQRALNILEKAFGSDHNDVATVLNNFANLKETTGQYADAELLYQRALIITEKALGPDHPDVSTLLNNFASLKETTGQYADAELLYLRALSIDEKTLGPDHPDVSTTLNNIAYLKEKAGQYANAESLYQKALSICEKAFGLNHIHVAKKLNNIGFIKTKTGQYADAEPLFQRAFNICEETLGPDHPDVAKTLNNIAYLKYKTGRYADAEPLYKRAYNICEKAFGPDHPNVALTLDNIALLKSKTGQYADAEPLYQRALSIREKAFGPGHPDVALTLENIAFLKSKTGQYADAEPLYQRALSIREKAFGPNHPNVATVLNNIASLKRQTGQYSNKEEVLSLYQKALEISQNSQLPESLWNVQHELSQFFSKENQNEMAIFFGKQAVNVIQGIRTNVHLMGDEIESLYTATVEEVFKHLADLLIVDGRFLEAEQVINLLKQHEYFEFIRRDAAYASELSGTVTFTELETQIDTRLAKKSITLAAFAKERTYLRNKKNRSINDEERLTTLDEKIEKANKAYQHTISKICKELDKTKHGDRTASIRSANSLQQDLKEVGHDAVAIYTVAGEKEFRTILITPTFRKAFSYPIGEKELRKKIFQFRRALLMGDGKLYDPIDLAKELYDIIIGPMAGELRDHEAKTLMWSLDGNLRYIPIAALYDYDGEKYLVETYRNIMFTPSTLARMKDNPKKDWEGFGLGVTEKYEKFHSLPYVREELANIIRSGDSPVGVMNGMICLDQAFTFDSLRNGISAHGYPLVHIASHFQLNPCNDTMSFLLLGDGTHLTLDKIKVQDALFGGVDLLTLSACNTAVGNDRQDGREVECFGLLAENQGAKAILATLWPVEDSSTSLLMQEFYRQHAKGKSKAEALRQAQIALLTGNIKPTIPPTWSKRKNKSKKDNGDPPEYRYEPDPQKPFAHPYFWAPFILIGNWK
ncbi:MAG: tetratricopeptide repeat protein [Syntrophus sp. (in: bacteria)]